MVRGSILDLALVEEDLADLRFQSLLIVFEGGVLVDSQLARRVPHEGRRFVDGLAFGVHH